MIIDSGMLKSPLHNVPRLYKNQIVFEHASGCI